MSDKKCPKCEGSTTHIFGGKNEFKTYQCDDCGYEFKVHPEPELTPDPPRMTRR